ncbi:MULTISPECIES: RNA-binding S4 domain-containing protein [unclassified Mesorhizobium]|uniref:RNA-binding S4 domain-containing protein n=1 Tax=unclassified Mesorhizobium TaxID=325217 RepID=UPI000F74F78A|nr:MULTISPECIES: RNA-binding S4 domain-containing protein [unclassified Mesorhizobium]AZO03594.1 RNA-binding S4 domain-containing protein [Mesorhizobium sp. M2A.F.Ca.ET.043.02.1.1]AZO18296.1 RNA-binding S4 domain-containing protein [Mesorhizobium sp. M2A.F.Ca.ET.043.05.1.1]RUW39363.1 RNA-binding S4 domain-containing protein [Mesorhizobium sp. M2A.F.Ca.ET.015.02.1.1]RUW64309.1 RNA-binding S4 domain-containing protein [Mesorhizobium sp. M2A.F.Ca.ET.067.02.1.1]RUX18826.1 RNA-binding S4 domain-con
MVGEGRQRIDKWLFFSRAVKSRSLAAKVVVAGRVRINRDKAAQASDLVKPGDVLTITLEGRILVWKVLDCGTRRGPADEARLLYQDMSPAPTPKGGAVADAIPALREAGSGRPTKRERRQTDRLLGDD